MAIESSATQANEGEVGGVLPWALIFHRIKAMGEKLSAKNLSRLYGVPRGGVIVAGLIQAKFSGEYDFTMAESLESADVIIDDIIDSGKTKKDFENKAPNLPFLSLIDKSVGGMEGKWVTFPWEVGEEAQGPTDNVRRLLQVIGEDPDREGLKATPDRVVRALKEMTSGTQEDPEEILSALFTEESEEMVVVRNIRFTSMCEHHMMPFMGVAHVGYLPSGKVVGLSKIPRLVDCFAKRLQIQERLTRQIGKTLDKVVRTQGSAVVLSATHCCMSCRGIQKQDADMVTSYTSGVFRNDVAARQEFFDLVNSS